jgi:hypothetical protein
MSGEFDVTDGGSGVTAVHPSVRRLVLVGRHNTGKSRLVCQLLRANPEAVVALPGRIGPPDLTKESDLRDRQVILLFDNIHVAAGAWRPLEWYERFSAIRCSWARPRAATSTMRRAGSSRS